MSKLHRHVFHVKPEELRNSLYRRVAQSRGGSLCVVAVPAGLPWLV